MKEYTTLDWLRELLPDSLPWKHEIVNDEIERLHAENEALRAKFEAGQADILRLCAENDALKAKNKAQAYYMAEMRVEADANYEYAERYRWLKAQYSDLGAVISTLRGEGDE